MAASRAQRIAPIFGGMEQLQRVLDQFATPIPVPWNMLPIFTADTSTAGSSNPEDSTPLTQGDEEESQRGEELVVYDIDRRRRIRGTDKYEWRVRWGSATGEVTWERRNAFVDSDGTANAIWRDFERNRQVRPNRKRKKD
jgi:hypothetical protein